MSQNQAVPCVEAARSLESAAAILFLQLIFPDRAPAMVKRLAWMGALSMGAHAAGALIPGERKEQLARKIRHSGSRVLAKARQGRSAPIRGVFSRTTCRAGTPCLAATALRNSIATPADAFQHLPVTLVASPGKL
jgi:hypothetical protein